MSDIKNTKIVSIFRTTFHPDAKIFQPTETGFLREVGVFDDDCSITQHVLSMIFEENCKQIRLSSNTKVRNYERDIKVYRDRIANAKRRFKVLFPEYECPDHILAVAVDFEKTQDNQSYPWLDVNARKNLNLIAFDVARFMVDGGGTQSEFSELSRVERFLVVHHVTEKIDDLVERSQGLHLGESHKIQEFARDLDFVRRNFEPIDYGEEGRSLSRDMKAKFSNVLKETKEMIDRLRPKHPKLTK